MVCQWGESGLIQICSHNYSIPADVNFPRLSLPCIHIYEVILSGYCSQLCYHSLFTTYAADTRVSIPRPQLNYNSPLSLYILAQILANFMKLFGHYLREKGGN